MCAKVIPLETGFWSYPSGKHNFNVKEMMTGAQQEKSYSVNLI